MNMTAIQGKWQTLLKAEQDKAYMRQLNRFLHEQHKQGKVIYPKQDDVFAAFNESAFDAIKVVILGQDPYHGPEQAHGLCFSVQPQVKIPPSLLNIYKELHTDLDLEIPFHGNLLPWAQQGVFLLNATLTVEAGQAGSHQGQGWEIFTDKAIQLLNDQRQNLVFMLWGSHAQKKGAFIDETKHLVLKAPHPSPLSAYRGFFGCQHFSKANKYLIEHNIAPIDWQLYWENGITPKKLKQTFESAILNKCCLCISHNIPEKYLSTIYKGELWTWCRVF